MYKAYTADDWRDNLGLEPGYTIEGFIVFGTYQKALYQMLREALDRLGIEVQYRRFDDEFLEPILEFEISGKRYWFAIAYGGALLSEYLHLACLFGSKKNVLLGTCSGLKHGASSLDFIVPDESHGEESSAKGYLPNADNIYPADTALSDRLANELAKAHTVHRGKTLTYQAMLSETKEDIFRWIQQGYGGVEMETATVFAVSKHFDVPAAAILRIGDNLVELDAALKAGYKQARALRHKVSQEAFDIVLRELIRT